MYTSRMANQLYILLCIDDLCPRVPWAMKNMCTILQCTVLCMYKGVLLSIDAGVNVCKDNNYAPGIFFFRRGDSITIKLQKGES